MWAKKLSTDLTPSGQQLEVVPFLCPRNTLEEEGRDERISWLQHASDKGIWNIACVSVFKFWDWVEFADHWLQDNRACMQWTVGHSWGAVETLAMPTCAEWSLSAIALHYYSTTLCHTVHIFIYLDYLPSCAQCSLSAISTWKISRWSTWLQSRVLLFYLPTSG